MATNQTDRPRFYEQQYLGSADLDALVDYERLARARHDLGAHSWGIASGLQIIEKTAAGGVDVYVQPGYAWDGFGRPLVAFAPFKISNEAFQRIPFVAGVDDGNPKGHLVDVWLAFTATPRGGPAGGFEACAVDDQFARIFESFQLVIGERPAHADQHASVTVGSYNDDAQNIPRRLGAATDPLLTDESIAYQTFPDAWDQVKWLVPLGSVRWLPPLNALASGNFVARDAGDLLVSDRKRRYVGVVAETLDAARGFVRVRRRDAANYAPSVWDSAADQSVLWVEGALRVSGDAKVLGGQLVMRDASNGDSGQPLAIRRREANGLPTSGRDLFVQIGTAQTGNNRFVVGPVTGTTPTDFKERLVVKDDGKVGIGVPNPTAAPLCVRAQGGAEDLLAFETPGGATSWKLSTLAGGKAGLNFGETTGDGRLFLQTGGNVGVGTTDPKHRLEIHGEDNALVVVSDATTGTAQNIGLELRTTAAAGVSYIDFTKGSTNLASSGTPDFGARISYNEANTGELSIRGGKVGIETADPTNQLHVNHNSGLRVNRLYASGGIGGKDRWSSLSFNAHHNDGNTDWVFPDPSHAAVTVEMDDWAGTPRFEVWSTTNAARTAWLRRMRIDGDSGSVLINENGGRLGVGTIAPLCRMHVTGSVDGADTAQTSHIALIENQSASTIADVLALRIGNSTPTASNNFITFFTGNTTRGSIQGTGSGVTVHSGSADYAEWMPRDKDESPMEAGDVVGAFGGRLRRATEGADHLFVISTSPAILANTPREEERADFERVAMLGQVPAKVRGKVRAGDVLVPSGADDGTAIAIKSDGATLDDHARAIGVAWEASAGRGVAQVRCAVGVTSADAWRAVAKSVNALISKSEKPNKERAPERATTKRR